MGGVPGMHLLKIRHKTLLVGGLLYRVTASPVAWLFFQPAFYIVF